MPRGDTSLGQRNGIDKIRRGEVREIGDDMPVVTVRSQDTAISAQRNTEFHVGSGRVENVVVA